jgi:hypothetical protein
MVLLYSEYVTEETVLILLFEILYRIDQSVFGDLLVAFDLGWVVENGRIIYVFTRSSQSRVTVIPITVIGHSLASRYCSLIAGNKRVYV